jgi:hypothetical protein
MPYNPAAWPADAVERRAISALAPFARNSRTHSKAQVSRLAASIQEWGWTIPVLIDEGGTIIAGHGRVLAARSLGIEEIPVMIAAGWSEAQRSAYVIADNRLAETAGWDEELLAAELGLLGDGGFDVDLTGFGQEDLASLLGFGDPTPGGEELNAAAPGSEPPEPRASLADRFGFVPFSVLSAREGAWQGRKAAWLALGIRSELGRGSDVPGAATPGGFPTPLDRAKNAASKAFNDGAALGGGGLADQVAKAANARRKRKQAEHG